MISLADKAALEAELNVELRGVTRINESRKKMDGKIFLLRLGALNASITAYRGGRSAAGFSAITGHLAELSAGLEGLAGDLTVRIQKMILEISRIAVRQRKNVLLRRAKDLSADDVSRAALRRGREDLKRQELNYRDELERNRILADQASKMSLIGYAAAVQLKIQSVQISNNTSSFNNVALQLETSLRELKDILLGIVERLEGVGTSAVRNGKKKR